ncbi:uncharacterized protein LOC141901597 [Tubulanus polymorphus]|uniref:uncharacterized protein LOC141901597 n=1 Tax=Tubulanus polymorphus TaxID=672921 RepID=UPI003DA564EB
MKRNEFYDSEVRMKQEEVLRMKREEVPLRMKREEVPVYMSCSIHQGLSSARHLDRYLLMLLGHDVDFKIAKEPEIEKHRVTAILQFCDREQCLRAVNNLNERRSEIANEINFSIHDDLKSAEARTSVEKLIKSISERSKPVLKQHEIRIHEMQKKLNRISNRMKNVPLAEFQSLIDEFDVVKSKHKELERQRAEFQTYLEELTSEIIATSDLARRGAFLTELARECINLTNRLPIYAHRTDIVKMVVDEQVSVILGETGSGKSSQLAKYLYQRGFCDKGLRVVCTQPRKVAAVSLAEHVATELGTSVGDTVGYRVGMQKRTSPATKIVYLTDYILLKECIEDPMLTEYSCIIIDEAHERSIHTDLLIGMIKGILPKRPELRVVITSATMNTDLFRAYFGGCPLLTVSGRTFPVDIAWKDVNEDEVTDDARRGLNDYVEKAVRKAEQIHKSEGKGDILVFLTSPAETERAMTMFQRTNTADDTLCLQLHGRLQADEQKRVFDLAPVGKRKIVFATNCAETSITIEGIKFVLDTGMVKEKKFDAIRNISSLVVTRVSKSSANQRKGRAGRMEAGKCFRLYSEQEYNEMDDSSKPEILRMHLGQALLQLLLLTVNVKNLRKFDFVEAPPAEAIDSALRDLVEIKAVDAEGKLTQLGAKIAKLPLDPRLGKLLLDSVDAGVGLEGLVLAASSTIVGSVFFRLGSDEQKKQADLCKIPFCESAGDQLTMLKVYRQWALVAEREKNRWCVENSINAKAMRMTRDTEKELSKQLDKELGIKLPSHFRSEEDSERLILPILFDTFSSNLCIYAGHARIGYTSVKSGQQVKLHPSSALNYLGETPKWLVFESVLKTSDSFILNVTPVNDSLVRMACADGSIPADTMTKAERYVYEPVTLADFGATLMKKLTGVKFVHAKELETEISRKCEDTLVYFDVKFDRGEIDVYAKAQYSNNVRDTIARYLEPFREDLRSEQRILPISERTKSVRVVLGTGAGIAEVLMPGEYKTVRIENIPPDFSDDEVLDIFRVFGVVKRHARFQAKPRRVSSVWGTITYETKEQAMLAVQARAEASEIKALPDIPRQTANNSGQNFEVCIEYTRRPAKNFGFIKFRDDADFTMAAYALKHVLVDNTTIINIKPSKNKREPHKPISELYMTGLPAYVDEANLKKALTDKLNDQSHMPINIDRLTIPRQPAYANPDEVRLLKDFIVDRLMFDGTLPENEYRIEIRDPTEKNFVQKASVYFRNPAVGESFIRSVRGDLRFPSTYGSAPLKVEARLFASLFLHAGVHGALAYDIDRKIEEICQPSPDLKIVKNPTGKGGSYRIDITMTANDSKRFAKCLCDMQRLIEGDPIRCTDYDCFKHLISQEGRQKLKTIEKDTISFIEVDKRTNTLNIFGTEKSRTSAKVAINKYLDGIVGKNELVVPVAGPTRPAGFLRALIKTYGKTFDALRTACEVNAIHVDLRRKVLKIHGSSEGQRKVEAALHDLARSMSDEVMEEVVEIECCVCFVPIDPKDSMYRLQLCGHLYCKECARGQIDHATNSKDFPIACAAENCPEQNWCLKDIHTFIQPDSGPFRKLLEAAISSFVSKNAAKFHYCLTPNCRMIYRLSDDGEKFTCPLCNRDICTTCNEQYHAGLTCGQYKSARADGVEQWMLGDSKNRKICPKCGIVIEKNDGCNHMTCRNCKAHFCWLCLAVSAGADEFYLHQRTCGRRPMPPI